MIVTQMTFFNISNVEIYDLNLTPNRNYLIILKNYNRKNI